ncbi:MAG: FecR domain-containing protein [Desulfitobacteriaceae bacterium]|nr:FecR domain-containing protein [Desulfitobacteriaceae bacterium]
MEAENAFSRTIIGQRYKKKITLQRIASISAIILIPLFSVVFSLLYIQSNHSDELAIMECYVPLGETKTIYLPDSSKVFLNSGSLLVYPTRFTKKNREVYLSGEALFSVTKDKKRMFRVITSDLDVEVLGTIFNVNSYPDNETTETTLKEGKVRIRLKEQPEEEILLQVNEQFSYNRKEKRSSTLLVETDDVLVWTKDRIIFNNRHINEVIVLMERKYNIRIFLNSEKYENTYITAKFSEEESIEGIFYVLKQIIPQFQYKKESESTYYIN